MAYDNQQWTKALSKFQPSSGYGAQSAGNPGMGGGSVPYAPGATQYKPPSSPPPAQGTTPPLSGGAPPPQGQGQPQGQGNGTGPQFGDPQRAIMIAQYLMARLQHQRAMREQGRRG